MPHILFARHGQTDDNLANEGTPETHVVAGQHNSQLTSKGRDQGTTGGRTIRSIPGVKIERILSSDLDRAIETAERIATQLPEDIAIEPMQSLRERSCGVFEGRLKTELKREFPQYFTDPALKNWRADFVLKAPGGENFTEVTERVRTALEPILATEERDILVVAHIRTICCALHWLLDLSHEETVRLSIPNAQPIIMKSGEPNALIGEWTLERLLTETGHLTT